MRKTTVCIIGAGLGGLSTAIALSALGYEVNVIEKNPKAGGKMNVYKEKGYTFDIGPHIITLPYIVEDLFSSVNKKTNSYFDLIKIDPLNHYLFSQNDFKFSQNKKNNENQISEKFPKDFKNYQKLGKLSQKYFCFSRSKFEEYKNKNLFQYLNTQVNLMRLSLNLPFISITNRLERLFEEKDLKDLYKSYSFYVGSDPRKTVSIYLMLDFIEQKYGNFYVKGGMYNLVRGFEKLAHELGVNFFYDTEITNIITEDSIVKSIKGYSRNLNKTIEFNSDIYVSNIDFGVTHKLITTSSNKRQTKINNEIKSYYSLPQSTSAFILLLGLDIKIEGLSHHNTFLSDDIDKEFNEIFISKTLPSDPTLGIDITSKTDPSTTPKGGETLFIMASPPSQSNIPWEKVKEEYANKIIRKIEERINKNLTEHVVVRKILTPHDISELYNQPFGAIYGQSVWGIKGLLMRKKNKSKLFKNLYFAGGSVRPGAGIPMVVSSGMTVAKLINKT